MRFAIWLEGAELFPLYAVLGLPFFAPYIVRR